MADGSDNFADAPAALLDTVTDAFSNVGYTVETGEQSPATDPDSEWFGASGFFTRSAWWRFDATVTQATQAHAQRSAYPLTTGPVDVLVSVFEGSDLSGLVLVARGSLGDGGGLGDTPDYTPWVANWSAEAGTAYFIQVCSIYDEDIDYRLTVVPTPTSFVGSWLDADPADLDITNPIHSATGLKAIDDTAASFPAAAASAWAGGTSQVPNVPESGMELQDVTVTTPTFIGGYAVGWWRYDALWPTGSTSYVQSIPDDEIAQPAHDSVEWEAVPASPGTDWRLAISINGSRERIVDGISTTDTPTDVLAYAKLGAYDVGGSAGDDYLPGFESPSAMSALSTLGSAHPLDPSIIASIPTGTDSVAFGLIDEYSLTGTYEEPLPFDAWSVYMTVDGAVILASVVPQYRYTYADVPTTDGAPTVAPPCQLHPRDDSLGAGSGAIWPPPSSQQAGMPGSYY